MTITAKVICDSISLENIRLTTLELRYPKFIHGEFLTHRMFSRNSSSSRAIPVKRIIEDIRRDPVIPVHWGKNAPGMQAREELTGTQLDETRHQWLSSMRKIISDVEYLIELGAHKQIANRLLEPWMHINTVVTATDWKNFFHLRNHPDAQPEIGVLANEIQKAMDASTPQLLEPDQWHLPYIGAIDTDKYVDDFIGVQLKCSVARCARVSYLTHDRRLPTVEEDLQLYDRLINSHPMHASPAEHQATPDRVERFSAEKWKHEVWHKQSQHGNFHGWIQYRKTLPEEAIHG